MSMIRIDNLKPGMILAANVYTRSGRMLLGADTELTDKHIHVFRTWGVIEADIAGGHHEDDTCVSIKLAEPDAWEKAEAAIRLLFVCTDLNHPAMQEILHLAILRKVQHDSH